MNPYYQPYQKKEIVELTRYDRESIKNIYGEFWASYNACSSLNNLLHVVQTNLRLLKYFYPSSKILQQKFLLFNNCSKIKPSIFDFYFCSKFFLFLFKNIFFFYSIFIFVQK